MPDFPWLGLLFECTACRDSAPAAATFPLCARCVASLVPAPALCRGCADPACPAALRPEAPCLRPWISTEGIDSFTALYALVGQGYPVLRRWKTSHGPAFDRRVLIPSPELLGRLRGLGGLDAVAHIPQTAARSWELGGSPAEKIARWVSRTLAVPHLSPLVAVPRGRGHVRQALLGLRGRVEQALRFGYDEDAGLRPGARILLVDDFMTSGHTLKAAARVLRGRGALAVHAFCLGIRFRRGKPEGLPDEADRV